MRGVKKLFLEVLNPKLGLLSVVAQLVQGGVVFLVNTDADLLSALLAAAKQVFFSFFWGGFFGRIAERFAEIKNPLLAYPLGSAVPTLMAYTLMFLVHFFTSTPKPLLSTILPMLISMFIYNPITIFVLRRGFFRTYKSRPTVKERQRMEREASAAESAAKTLDADTSSNTGGP